MTTQTSDLAATIRAWRDRLSPAAAGLPLGHGRRATGLRREELADLAGISVDYVVRLEQGRATTPSAQVVAALARALRLTIEERNHLYRLAKQVAPSAGEISDHINHDVRRVAVVPVPGACARRAGAHREDSKILEHPSVGPIALDCDVLTDGDAELRIVILAAAPDTEDESKLRLATSAGSSS